MTWVKAASGLAYIGSRRKHNAAGDARFSEAAVVAPGSLDTVTTNDVGLFTNDSVGKVIGIPYAGIADGGGHLIPKCHVTTISQYISSSVVRITTPAPVANNIAYTVLGAPKVLGGFVAWGSDDTVPLRNWMTDCSQQRKPGELEPPGGGRGYLTTGQLTWPDYCHIKGYGRGLSMIFPVGFGFSCFRYAGSDNVFVIDPQMDEIEIDMRGVNESTYTTTTKAVYLTHWKHGRFENNYWHDSPATAFGSDFPVDGCGVRGNLIERGGRQVDELGGSAGGSGFGIGTGKYLYEELDLTSNEARDCGFYDFFHEAQTTANPLSRGYRTIGNIARGGKYGFGEEGTDGSIWANNQSYDTTVAHYRISKAFTNRYGKGANFNNNNATGGNAGVEINTGDGRFTWTGGELTGMSSDAFQFNDTGTDANTPPHPTEMHIISPNVHDVGGRGVRFLGGTFGIVELLGGRYVRCGNSTSSRRPAIGVERPIDVLKVMNVSAWDDRAGGAKMQSYGLEATALIGELFRVDNDFPTTGSRANADGAYNLATAPTVDRFRALP